jgi:hypothetical protein
VAIIEIPFLVLQTFCYSQFRASPKLCPWVEKEYVELMNRTFPTVFKKLGSKQRVTFFRSLLVDIVPTNCLLAEENHITDPKHILVVVSGNLRFFKRSEKFYAQKS